MGRSLHYGSVLRAGRRQLPAASLIMLQIAIGFAAIATLAVMVMTVLHRDRRYPTADLPALSLVRVERAAGTSGRAEDPARDLAILRALPGVTSVAQVETDPAGLVVGAPDRLAPESGGAPATSAYTLAGGAQMVHTLGGITLQAGRDFTDADVAATRGGEAVPAILSRQLADALYPGLDPLGRVFASREVGRARIVGVAAELRFWEAGVQPSNRHVLYARLPEPAEAPTSLYLVRSAAAGRAAVDAAIPGALVRPEASGRWITATALGEPVVSLVVRIRKTPYVLAATIAAIILILAGGVFALAAHEVQVRTRQIGLRRALGARRRDILVHFLFENFLLTGAGVSIGLVIHLALVHELRRIMVGFGASPWVAVWAALGMFAIGQLAAFVPAYRAAAIPPSVASRTV